MEENISTGYEDFMSALDGDGYQTEAEESVETEPEGTEEPTASPEDDGEGDTQPADDPKGESGGEDATDGGDGGEGREPAAEETFTIKVNKEERSVSREEVITLAQKGADYDRVKEQLAESRQTNQGLQEQLTKYQSAIDLMDMLTDGTPEGISAFVDSLHKSALMSDGKTEKEAEAEIRAAKAEKKLGDAQKAEAAQKAAADDTATRAEREIAEFSRRFPEVDLTEELCNELMADVRKGLSLADAYQKKENAKRDAEIAELKRQLEAEKQNSKNRAKSPGSQKDSGGRRTKSDYDDFMAALNS